METGEDISPVVDSGCTVQTLRFVADTLPALDTEDELPAKMGSLSAWGKHACGLAGTETVTPQTVRNLPSARLLATVGTGKLRGDTHVTIGILSVVGICREVVDIDGHRIRDVERLDTVRDLDVSLVALVDSRCPVHPNMNLGFECEVWIDTGKVASYHS